jgi:hypothetical protein
MSVRRFDWRDLPTLHSYRNQCLFLDSTHLLSNGPRLIPARAIFTYLALSSGIYMYQASSNGKPNNTLLGQVIHKGGRACARLAFLTPASALDSPNLTPLIERMVKDIGHRGGTHLLAEVNEAEGAFESLRKAGFATYARQRVWQLENPSFEPVENTNWRRTISQDLIAIRGLYANLIPGLVQQVEQAPARRPRGYTFRQAGDLLAYVDIKKGPSGIVMQPFIHPDLENVSEILKELVALLPEKGSNKPVYLYVRSYQSWLEPSIEDLGAKPGPRQAVMVRHLAVIHKQSRAYLMPVLDRGQPEISAPITRRILNEYETKRNNG